MEQCPTMGSIPINCGSGRGGWCWITVTSTVAVGSDLFGGRYAGTEGRDVRLWVRQAERDTGRRPGATTEELAELKRLKRENAELRAHRLLPPSLKAAATFFGAELDRKSTK